MSKKNCKYLLSVKKSLGYGDSTDVRIKVKIKTETNRFSYVMRAMCQSLSYGNTDQIGRRAWNGFMEYIEKSVATFVNECNAKYRNGKDPKINPRATSDFLPNGIPEFMYTTTHNNTYDISIGQTTSSLTMEQVMSVYEKAKETEERKNSPVKGWGGLSKMPKISKCPTTHKWEWLHKSKIFKDNWIISIKLQFIWLLVIWHNSSP